MVTLKVVSRAWICVLFVCIFLPLSAGAQSVPEGIAVLNSSKGNDPRNVVFVDVSWPNPYVVVATGMDGTTDKFEQGEVTRILYFDQVYYDQMNTDRRYVLYRDGFQGRESVVQTQFPNVRNAGQLAQVQASIANIGDFESRFPTTTEQLTPIVTSLNAIILKYQSGQREVSERWMTLAEYEAQFSPKVPAVEPVPSIQSSTAPVVTLKPTPLNEPDDSSEPTVTPKPVSSPFSSPALSGINGQVFIWTEGVLLVITAIMVLVGILFYSSPYEGAQYSGLYAGFGSRLVAYCLDMFILIIIQSIIDIVLVVFLLSIYPLPQTPGTQPNSQALLAHIQGFQVYFSLIQTFIISVYFIVLDGTGGTIGKRIMGIIVVTLDGTPIDVMHSLVRCFARSVNVCACCMGYLLPLFDDRKRALHDYVAGTLVIER